MCFVVNISVLSDQLGPAAHTIHGFAVGCSKKLKVCGINCAIRKAQESACS